MRAHPLGASPASCGSSRDLVVADLARRAGPRLVVETVHTVLGKRLRHVPTVCVQTPSFDAISLFLRPPAAANTMRARSAIACGAPCLRVNAVSSRFSTSSSTIATARPLAIPATFPHERRECK